MKGKRVVAAGAAKRHTLVLTAGGEVYTWGHRGVSPRRVQLAVSAVAGWLPAAGAAEQWSTAVRDAAFRLATP